MIRSQISLSAPLYFLDLLSFAIPSYFICAIFFSFSIFPISSIASVFYFSIFCAWFLAYGRFCLAKRQIRNNAWGISK